MTELHTGRVVFALNCDRPLVPASTMKVFTMAAALSELTPPFSFETVLATDGVHLYVIGDGDPAFGDEKLHQARREAINSDFVRWAEALRQRGFRNIPGDLVLDESVFDDQRIHPSWDRDDLDNWYAAPVGGINYNGNCVDISVVPSKKHDSPVMVTVQPPTSIVQIINECRSGGKGQPTLHHLHDSFGYAVRGRCPKSWSFGSVSFPDPGLLFADAFRTHLAGQGIQIQGQTRRARIRLSDGQLPPQLQVVARRTTPLSEVLQRIGRDSQNLFAESLLKRTGYAWAKRNGLRNPEGSWQNGRNAVLATLDRAGVSPNGLVVSDGSGLSRENRCTAEQLTALLAWIRTQPGGQMFEDSLSEAGVDGSLGKRLKDIPGRVHAKTGTMRGIRSLCGYIENDSSPAYAFAVIFNGFSGSSTPYKEIQDRFCRVLAGVDEPRKGRKR